MFVCFWPGVEEFCMIPFYKPRQAMLYQFHVVFLLWSLDLNISYVWRGGLIA